MSTTPPVPPIQPLAPRFTSIPGVVPSEARAWWTAAAQSAAGGLRFIVVAPWRDAITDEPFLVAVATTAAVQPALSPRDCSLLLATASQVARASGASWSPAVDAWAHRALPTGMVRYATAEGHEMTRDLVAWIATVTRTDTLAACATFHSRLFRRTVSMHARADRLTDAGFTALQALGEPGDLWMNPTLTPSQRARVVQAGARAIVPQTDRHAPRHPFPFLAEAMSRSGSESPAPALTSSQMTLLVEAAVAQLPGDTMPAVILLYLADLPFALVERLVGAMAPGPSDILPDFAVRQIAALRAVPTPYLCDLLATGRVHRAERVEAMRVRPDVLRDQRIRRRLPEDADPELLQMAAKMALPEEFARAFERLRDADASMALDILVTGAIPDGAFVDPAWIAAFLEDASSQVRATALLLAAEDGPLAGKIKTASHAGVSVSAMCATEETAPARRPGR
jgi:hypothetical protein